MIPSTPDLVVLSHLRWDWVWQRPQHLVARFALERSAAGARTWFVEEPMPADVATSRLAVERAPEGVTRVRLLVPQRLAGHSAAYGVPSGFDSPAAARYPALLADLVATSAAESGQVAAPDVLLYTPMAGPLAEELEPGRVAYDVMDDLASFAAAPPGLRTAQRRLLDEADVVYTGGRSLHRQVAAKRRRNCHLFPSGVDAAHYARSLTLRRPHARPVAGYVGVLDERLNLDLLAELAELLPDWTIRLVGPVAKIEPESLPQGPNLEYPGQVDYHELPEVMAGFDVALMPFALNEATRSISPTKTLEYLAAGLPVVSTPVPDVVADHSEVVDLALDAADFARCCRRALLEGDAHREHRIRRIRGQQEWSVIAAEMSAILARLPQRNQGVLAAGVTA